MAPVGADQFAVYAEGGDVDAAFDTVRDDARHERGAGGYTGSIAEKDGYIIIINTVMDEHAAQQLAEDLIENSDPRIDDKWGPAGAIPVRRPTRPVIVDNLPGPAPRLWQDLDPPSLRTATQTARERGLIRDGETVQHGRVVGHRPAGPAGAATYSTELTVHKGSDNLQAQTIPDCWLFFGWASS